MNLQPPHPNSILESKFQNFISLYSLFESTSHLLYFLFVHQTSKQTMNRTVICLLVEVKSQPRLMTQLELEANWLDGIEESNSVYNSDQLLMWAEWKIAPRNLQNVKNNIKKFADMAAAKGRQKKIGSAFQRFFLCWIWWGCFTSTRGSTSCIEPSTRLEWITIGEKNPQHCF